MALTYKDSADLMNDFQFRGRIKVAALKFADYVQNEAPGTQGHAARYRWAQQTYLNPEMATMQIHPPVVMDAAVQQDGANITDAALQTAVEGVIAKFI